MNLGAIEVEEKLTTVVRPVQKEAVFKRGLERSLVTYGSIAIVVYSLIASTILQAVGGRHHFVDRVVGCQVAAAILNAPVVAFSVWINQHLFRRVRWCYIGPAQVLCASLATNLAWAAVYWTSYEIGADSVWSVMGFNDMIHPANASVPATGPKHVDVYVAFVYFSCTIASTTGFGDISVVHWTTDFISSLHMVFSAAYTIGLFAISMSHFQTLRPARAPAQLRPGSIRARVEALTRSCTPFLARFRHFIVRWIFVLSIFIQLICYIAICVPYQRVSDDSLDNSAVVITILQIVQIGVLMYCTLHVVRQLHRGRLSGVFLVQSYLATLLAFGGLYFTVYIFAGDASFYLAMPFQRDPFSAWEVAMRLLYLSVSVATSTGLGDVVAVSSIPRIMVTLHMMVTVVYTVVILGSGVNALISLKDTFAAAHHAKKTQRQRRRAGDRQPTREAFESPLTSAGGSPEPVPPPGANVGIEIPEEDDGAESAPPLPALPRDEGDLEQGDLEQDDLEQGDLEQGDMEQGDGLQHDDTEVHADE